MDDVLSLVSEHRIDVLTFSETWPDTTIMDSEVSLPGYIPLRRDRNWHGGGVAIYDSSLVKFKPRPDLQSDKVETLWIELYPASNREILVCCAYQPPSQSQSIFFDEMLSEFDWAVSMKKRVVLMGDLNCNLLDPSQSNTKHLTSFCRQLKLTELVGAPTRLTGSTASQLDVILTNSPDYFHETSANPFSASDHHLIFTHLGLKTPQPPKYIDVRNYRKLDIELLQTLMGTDDLQQTTDSTNVLRT